MFTAYLPRDKILRQNMSNQTVNIKTTARKLKIASNHKNHFTTQLIILCGHIRETKTKGWIGTIGVETRHPCAILLWVALAACCPLFG